MAVVVIDWREVEEIASFAVLLSKLEVRDFAPIGWPQGSPERALEPTHESLRFRCWFSHFTTCLAASPLERSVSDWHALGA